MAEFQEVMRQAARMCKAHVGCIECPFCNITGGKCPIWISRFTNLTSEDAERIVMDWAKEHPEQVYPSWNDAWGRLFPKTYKDKAPCPMHFVGHDRKPEVCAGISCDKCRDRPIPADIAEKLGIKPVEGT